MLPNSQIALILKTSAQLMTQHDVPSLKMIHNIAFMSLVENGCKTEDGGENIIINIEKDSFKLPYDYVCSFVGEEEYAELKKQTSFEPIYYERSNEIVQPYRDILTGVMPLEDAIDYLETEAAKINEEQPQESVREKIDALKAENKELNDKIEEQNQEISLLNEKLSGQEQLFNESKKEWAAEKEKLVQAHSSELNQLVQKYQETIAQISKQYTERENKILNKHAAELDKLRIQLLKGQKLGRKSMPIIIENPVTPAVGIEESSLREVENAAPAELTEPTNTAVPLMHELNDKENVPTNEGLGDEDPIIEIGFDPKYLFPTEDKIYRLSMDELTFNMSSIEIRDSFGNKVDSCEIIAFPMTLKEKTPKICTCLIRNQESYVRASTPEYASVKQKCGNYPIFVKGTMDGATFKCEVDLGNATKKQGYELSVVKTRDFGQGGHIYLPDGAYHVHLLPVSSRNNELNQADYIYAVEDEQGNIIECGDNSYGEGVIEVKLPSGIKRINCRWQDNVLYGDLAAQL